MSWIRDTQSPWYSLCLFVHWFDAVACLVFSEVQDPYSLSLLRGGGLSEHSEYGHTRVSFEPVVKGNKIVLHSGGASHALRNTSSRSTKSSGFYAGDSGTVELELEVSLSSLSSQAPDQLHPCLTFLCF